MPKCTLGDPLQNQNDMNLADLLWAFIIFTQV